MKKGFTLIELLAVIIILAIIALIATPIVLDVIDDAKNSAAKSEASMIVSGVNNYCAAAEMQEQLTGKESICTDADGVTKEDVSTMVDLGNAKVNSITYDGKVTLLEVESNNKVVTYDGNIYTIDGEVLDTPEVIYNEALLNGADPVLDEGMIPVIIDSDGTLRKADVKNEWYKYEDKKWANVALVTESSRNGYIEAVAGSKIKQEDVLAYYVWVPRYRYQIFTDVNNFETVGEIASASEYINKAKLINVVFENNTTLKSNGTNKGEWLTHPAFTFGSVELSGIWVGKFETTGTEEKPTVLAYDSRYTETNNITSLKNQNVSTQFLTSQKLNYGLTDLEASMLKNMEWGAIAYLTNSEFGRCKNGVCEEVMINNSSYFYTGCAATVTPTQTYSGYIEQTDHTEGHYAGCENEWYTTAGQKASNTGNITGIYDMVGGSVEYVMGVMEDSINSNIPTSGRNLEKNSGFTGNLTNSNDESTNIIGVTFPDSKYYDLYSYESTSTSFASGHLGDATYELDGFAIWADADGKSRYHNGWNKDRASFTSYSVPWFIRSGGFDDGASAGVFSFNSNSGGASNYNTFRSVLR